MAEVADADVPGKFNREQIRKDIWRKLYVTTD